MHACEASIDIVQQTGRNQTHRSIGSRHQCFHSARQVRRRTYAGVDDHPPESAGRRRRASALGCRARHGVIPSSSSCRSGARPGADLVDRLLVVPLGQVDDGHKSLRTSLGIRILGPAVGVPRLESPVASDVSDVHRHRTEHSVDERCRDPAAQPGITPSILLVLPVAPTSPG